MNGDTTGLESADSSSTVDPPKRLRRQGLIETTLKAAENFLEEIHEYKASREVRGALDRWQSSPDGEGQRSGEAVHGEDTQAPQVALL